MTTTKDPIIAVDRLGAIAVLAEPRQCRCGHFAMIFFNRNGRTLCGACDDSPIEGATEDPSTDSGGDR